MLEKILQKLKEQRAEKSNVSDRSLADLAATYVPLITTDEQLEAADFTAAIVSIDGNINNYTAAAVKAAAAKGTPPTTPTPPATGTPPTPAGDDMPAWAKALMEQNKALSEGLTKLQTEKVTTGRASQLEGVLKDAPDFFKKPILSTFSKTAFETEEEFTAYLEEVKAVRTDFEQKAAEQGMNVAVPSKANQPKNDGGTPVLSEALAMIQKKQSN
jgi:hypothetical protein